MSLSFPTKIGRTLNSLSKPKRLAMVHEAIGFPTSNNERNKEYTTLYSFEDYEIKVGKPGKEVALVKFKHADKTIVNNANDMTPTIFRNGEIIERDGSFLQIFRQFIHIYQNRKAVEMIACLCIRNAFTLDHTQNNDGNWRYTPSQEIIEKINQLLPEDFPEPIEVFLYYLEAIALNEDIKYYTLGHNNDFSKAIGRKNNLLTYANLIRVMLHKAKVSETDFFLEFIEFSGRLMSPPLGVHPITLKEAFVSFPQLEPIE